MSVFSSPEGTPVRPSPQKRSSTFHDRRPSYTSTASFTASKLGPVIFAFGPGERYMICNGSRWWWNDIPEQLQEAVGEQGRNVDSFIACAFGAGDQHFMTLKQRGGKITQRRHQLPAKLNDWLYKNSRYTRNLETLRVTLGPDGSFFAMDKNGLRWDKLPEKLEAQLQDSISLEGWRAPPRTVALGTEGAFVLVDWKGNVFRDLKDRYDDLEKYLSTPNIGRDIEFISLDGTRGKYYFVKKKGGRRYWTPPALEKLMPEFIRQLTDTAVVAPRSIESVLAEKMTIEDQLEEQLSLQQALQDANKDLETRLRAVRKDMADKRKEWKERNDTLTREVAAIRTASTSAATKVIAMTNERVSHDSTLRQQLQAAQQTNEAHNKAMMELNTQFVELMNSVSSNK